MDFDPDFDAVVLAGGSGARLGGVDKGALEVGGVRMLDRVLMAAGAARRTVVAGVARGVRRPVTWVREDPPGGGPVAGLAAAVAALDDGNANGAPDDGLDGPRGGTGPDEVPGCPVLVLATDLPRITAGDVTRLQQALAGAPADVDAVLFADADGRAQPLAAIYRRDALSAALAAEQPVDGRPMRAVVARLSTITIPDHGAAADCDTPEQLISARAGRGEDETS